VSTTGIPVSHLLLNHPLSGLFNPFLAGKGSLSVALDPTLKEGYDLSISPEGIRIQGSIPQALSHLARLIEKEGEQTFLPVLKIHEQPRFSYRGVLLDEARHYFGKENVKALLLLMWKCQLNTFHWHLSDDQGFRLALERYPRLKEACYRDGTKEGYLLGPGRFVEGRYGYSYSENDIQEIVSYAATLGIEIIPEIDMPGHLSAILSAYPEYTHDQKPFSMPNQFGIFDHTPCLGNPEAREFLMRLVEDVAYLFKAKHFHLGFDEVKHASFQKCERCQKAIEEQHLHNEEGLIEAFRKEIEERLFRRGVIPIVWNDGLKTKDGHVISEVWELHQNGNRHRAIRQINQGQNAIIAPFFSTYVSNPYCVLPLKKAYNFDPYLSGIRQKQNVLGAEICYWSEYGTSPEKFDFEFSLRAAIIARTLWSVKKATFEKTIEDLQAKSSFYFSKPLSLNLALMNPSFFHRISHFVSYTKDVDWELKKR
jgi:hexosaminidase